MCHQNRIIFIYGRYSKKIYNQLVRKKTIIQLNLPERK